MAVGELVTRTGVTLQTKLRAIYIPYTGASGTFEYGETITGGTSSATARVAFVEADKLFVYEVSGTFGAAEGLTGGTSGATATADGATTTGNTAAWLNLARVRDTFTVNRSRPTTTITDFDSVEYDFADKIAGNQEASASFTVNLVPGGTSYQQMEAAMDGNLDVYLKRIQVDRQGTNTRTNYYTAIVTGFNESDSVTDASTVAVTLEISDVSQTDPTA
jgi:hypothetical protein